MKNNYVVYSFNKVKKLMHQYLDKQLKNFDISDIVPAYGDILTALYINDGQLKMNQISDMVGKDKSTITVLVNRLCERGYVDKEKSKLDKRVTYIRLSKKAYDYENEFLTIASNVKSVAFNGFTHEEQEQFMAYLSRMHDNFQENL
ncbi:MAG: MarR family transcriptional regulator [Clostridiales bacterium]|nr:MarR family transcriptional regulator [Clostridiales bacterium]